MFYSVFAKSPLTCQLLTWLEEEKSYNPGSRKTLIASKLGQVCCTATKPCNTNDTVPKLKHLCMYTTIYIEIQEDLL